MISISGRHIKRIKDPRMSAFISDIGFIDDNIVLAGGALRGIFGDKSPIADFDVFFVRKPFYKSMKQQADAVATNLVLVGYTSVFKCPEGKLETFKKVTGFSRIRTALGLKPRPQDVIKVQLITEKYYDNIKQLLDDFDINACRIAFTNTLIYTFYEAIRDIRRHRVTLHAISHPHVTFKRLLKYHDKGYTIPNQTIEKYAEDIWKLGSEKREFSKRFYID